MDYLVLSQDFPRTQRLISHDTMNIFFSEIIRHALMINWEEYLHQVINILTRKLETRSYFLTFASLVALNFRGTTNGQTTVYYPFHIQHLGGHNVAVPHYVHTAPFFLRLVAPSYFVEQNHRYNLGQLGAYLQLLSHRGVMSFLGQGLHERTVRQRLGDCTVAGPRPCATL